METQSHFLVCQALAELGVKSLDLENIRGLFTFFQKLLTGRTRLESIDKMLYIK